MHTPADMSKTKQKKHGGSLLWLALVIIVFLFLLTTILLGSRLYDLTTRDQHTVDFGVGELDGSIELFRIEYSDKEGNVVVQGANADSVVAPGTAVDYNIRLRNNDDMVIDFIMEPEITYLSEDVLPVQFKLMDDYGNYLIGDENTWVSAEAMNGMLHKGQIHPGEVFTYHLSWQWIFEVDEEQNAFDTYLGNLSDESIPGISVGLRTSASANPYISTKDVSHKGHMRGESFGCCWCCWLVWVLLLLCLLLVLRLRKFHQKVTKQAELLEEYEEILRKNELLPTQK